MLLPDISLHNAIVNVVRARINHGKDTETLLQSQIDQLVYERCGLTEEEIAIVEAAVK